MYVLAQATLWVATIYVCLGALFAAGFVLRWVDDVDPDAEGSGLGFRLAILPGTVLFWPLFVIRTIRRTPMPVERTRHRNRGVNR